MDYRKIILLCLFPSIVWALNPNCPDFSPPSTTPNIPLWSYNTTSLVEACTSHCTAQTTNTPGQGMYYSSSYNTTPTSGKCLCSYWPGGPGAPVAGTMSQQGITCPAGYTLNGSICNLTNGDVVPCPSVTCTAGESIGFGMLDPAFNNCVNQCEVRPRGTTAAERDQVDNSIGLPYGEYEKTGVSCSIPLDPPPPPAPDIKPENPVCLTNSQTGTTLCFDPDNPGCIRYDGSPRCMDEVGLNECELMGFDKYLCVSDDNNPKPTPPTLPGEPPPKPDFDLRPPIKGPNGPPHGIDVPGSPGGTGYGETGKYPGPGGNGTDPNQDPGQGGGTCDEAPYSLGCMPQASFFDTLKNSIKEANKDFVKDAIGEEPTTGPKDVPSKAWQPTLNPVTVPNSAGCPAPLTASVHGIALSFSYDPLCTYATQIKPLVMVIASLSALFIASGMSLGGSKK